MSSKGLAGLMLIAAMGLNAGCHDGVSVEQSWKLRITYSESGETVGVVRVFDVSSESTRSKAERGESVENIVGISFMTNSNGVVEIRDGSLVVCFREPSLVGTACSDVVPPDLHTGERKSVLIDDGSASELLDFDLIVGGKSEGDVFGVEVVSISPPELR